MKIARNSVDAAYLTLALQGLDIVNCDHKDFFYKETADTIQCATCPAYIPRHTFELEKYSNVSIAKWQNTAAMEQRIDNALEILSDYLSQED